MKLIRCAKSAMKGSYGKRVIHKAGTRQIKTIKEFHKIYNPVNTTKISKLKCISNKTITNRKLHRKKNGELARTKYMKIITNDDAGKGYTDKLTEHIIRKRLQELHGTRGEQALLLFKLLEIKKTHKDATSVYLHVLEACYPGRVPRTIKSKMIAELHKIEPDRCFHCGHYCEKDFDTNRFTCESCGTLGNEDYNIQANIFNSVQDADAPGYTITQKHIYDRMNNFKTALNYIQGIGNSKIDAGVITSLSNKAKTHKEVTPQWVITQLKKMKQGRYIPQRYRIAQTISSYKPITIELCVRAKMIQTFTKICCVFDKLKQAECPLFQRKNFMSYPFVLYKLLILFNNSNGIKYIKLPQGTQSKKKNEMMWNKICEELELY